MKKRLTKNRKHGGKRHGAGRKVASPDGLPAVRVSVSMPAELSAWLDQAAGSDGTGRSHLVVEAVRLVRSVRQHGPQEPA